MLTITNETADTPKKRRSDKHQTNRSPLAAHDIPYRTSKGQPQQDFSLGKDELRRLLRLFWQIADSAEVKKVLRGTLRIDLQWHALIRREARSQGLTIKELEFESGEKVSDWRNPAFNKVLNILDTLGYQMIAVPKPEIYDARTKSGKPTQEDQLRTAFLGAPNHILTREYLASILYPWESYRDQRNYKVIDVLLSKMRKKYPDLAPHIKSHWAGGWEYTPEETHKQQPKGGRPRRSIQN